MALKSSDYKAPGGKLVRVRLEEKNGEIQTIHLSGDFFLVPEENLAKLEKTLVGTPLRESDLRLLVNRFFHATQVQGLGVAPDDFVKAVLLAEESSQ